MAKRKGTREIFVGSFLLIKILDSGVAIKNSPADVKIPTLSPITTGVAYIAFPNEMFVKYVSLKKI
jgi:hypothetical protein